MPTMEQVADDLAAERRREFVTREGVDDGLKTWGKGEDLPRLWPERRSTIRRR